MELAKKLFSLGMVAFWALMTSHCSLEAVSNLSFIACFSEASSGAHQPTDCRDTDACADVESGQYRSEESQVSVAKESVASVAFAVAILSEIPILQPSLADPTLELTPPELAHAWQFSFRAALPPRAPSFLS